MAIENSPHLYRSGPDSASVPCGILINKEKRELRRRVMFSRVVMLNKPTTFILVKEERGLGSIDWFNVDNALAAFFQRKFRASTIQSTVAIETTLKVLSNANILLNIATNDSFKDENEGDAVDSKANNNVSANTVEAKPINGHAEQEAIYQMMLLYL
ncbi:hypothetical protein MAM1_0173c07226 [Mucor ambiguus]|uniref:Uncharacterized protein n=1 Tax=Mucor ambiguus TaxID=91626 RepID=A0A0C9MZM1_9FUNG|nr:hypothetical protein MAM1_0173c07226 [Mucor ambiguus]